MSGVHSVMECCRELKGVRNDVDGFSNHIFQHSSRIADISGISVSMPRVRECQRHRSNPEFASVEEYFKKTIVIPFLDHLIIDISSRFSKHSLHVASLQNLVPVKMSNETDISTAMREAIKFYSTDLPNPSLQDEELYRWKTKWTVVPVDKHSKTLSETLANCNSVSLLNVFTLLKLFATLPLRSCSCERSASARRRLNNSMRCTQTEECLTALAFIHMNYEAEFCVDEVCRKFFEKHPCRMEKANLLFDN